MWCVFQATSDNLNEPEVRNLSPQAARLKFRTQGYSGPTSGFCDGFLQCNLMVLPEQFAQSFEEYCLLNPVSCPLVSHAPTPHGLFEELGHELDLRTDLPLYNIIKSDSVIGQVPDLVRHWHVDLHAFALGCSFTFERALADEGIALRHIEEQKTVPMFRTNIETIRAGPFRGPMVVSMRPIAVADIEKTRAICNEYPHAHGPPIHIGDPKSIGISDLQHPDWGDPVSLKNGEVPVFWGCGVTSHLAVLAASPNIAFSHAPGAMLITDWAENARANHNNQVHHQPTRSSS
nr:putative hydro-lyase [Thalassobius sp. I31.1]